jgi:microcystin-dependent protein
MSVSSAPDFIPAGSVFCFAGLTCPNGYLLCDGSDYPIANYPALFNAIGNTFTALPDDINFQVPNLVDTYVSGTNEVSGATNTSGANGNVSITLSSGNIPKIVFKSGSLSIDYTAVSPQPSTQTKSDISEQKGCGSEEGDNHAIQDTSPTTRDIQGIFNSLAISYLGNNTPISAPLTSGSGSITLEGIKLTYIIKAFGPTYSQYNYGPEVPESDRYISTAINPNLNNPILSGFISS